MTCMRHGVFPLNGTPGAASHLDDCVHFQLFGSSFWLVHLICWPNEEMHAYIFIVSILSYSTRTKSSACFLLNWQVKSSSKYMAFYFLFDANFSIVVKVQYIWWIMVAMDMLKEACIWKRKYVCIYIDKFTLYCILTRTTVGEDWIWMSILMPQSIK